MKHSEKLPLTAISAAYAATVVLTVAASLLPGYRLWGLNVWAFLPAYAGVIALTVGILAWVVLYVSRNRLVEGPEESAVSYPWPVLIVIPLLSGVLFYLLRGQYHYLGDGYSLLANLGSPSPIVKPREIGAEWVNGVICTLIGKNSEGVSLATYRSVSIGAGVLYVATVLYFGRKLFDAFWKQLIFVLLMLSGGQMLMFFGYVENYSLFCLSIAWFVLLGMLITTGRLNRWWILVPTVAALWFHVVGVSLLPAGLYVLAFAGGKGRRIAALQPSTWGLVLGIGLVGSLVLFVYLYTHDLFFKLAFVPLVAYRFTAAGYTLFSLRHLADTVNLLMILQPGLIVLVTTLLMAKNRAALKQASVRFLLLVAICTVFAISILDPKLGMPRDWDLLSIPGVPLAAAAALLLVTIKLRREVVITAGILASTLGLLSLAGRVAAQIDTDAALAQIRNYYRLDPARSAPIRLVLFNNLLDAGDTATALVEQAAMLRDYPQQSITDTGIALAERGDYPRAKAYFERAIRIDPLYHKAWTNLGSALAQLGMPDSALAALEISTGLNPYNVAVYYAMGFAWFTKGDYAKGERYLKLARRVDTISVGPLIGLSMLYQASGQSGKYAAYVDTILIRPTTPYQYLRLIGDNCLQKGDVPRAARAYAAGLKNGLDTSYVRRMAEQFPELLRTLRQ